MRLDTLLSRGVVCFDGGFGSQLTARAVPFACAEALNLTRPDAVRAIHHDYVRAGAQVVETNTLGANPIRLRAHGLAEDAARIVGAAVEHARQAGAPCVACSMGTTAEFLAPVGTLSFEEATACFAAPARAAAEAGADFLLTETLTDLAEARAMWAAAREAGLPFAASFAFTETGRTLGGNPPEACALSAWAMGARMVGVNCVADGAQVCDIVRRMRAVCPLPVIAQPNAGLPERVDGALRYRVGPEEFVAMQQDALAAGAAAVGGCCGTTPEHIRRLAQAVRGLPAPAPGGDGCTRICGPRGCLTLAEAQARCETMALDALDVSDAPAVLLDMRGASPQEAAAGMEEALLLLRQPLLLRADDAQTLDAALRIYPGVAAVDAPFAPGWGAVRI